jgi:hypothetical protein
MVGSWVDGVLLTSNIVGGIVHSEYFCRVDPIINYTDCVPLGWRKGDVIAVKFSIKEPSEQVIFKLWKEILMCNTILTISEVWTRRYNLTFVAGSFGNRVRKESTSWGCFLDSDMA